MRAEFTMSRAKRGALAGPAKRMHSTFAFCTCVTFLDSVPRYSGCEVWPPRGSASALNPEGCIAITCPKCEHENTAATGQPIETCPQCGVIYARSAVQQSQQRQVEAVRDRVAASAPASNAPGLADGNEADPQPTFATELAIYETAVVSMSMTAPNWAAFSRWLSAGAGTVIGLTISNLLPLAIRDDPVSTFGACLAALPLGPALRIEWIYLVLQPISAATKAGEAIFEKAEKLPSNGAIDHLALAAQAPRGNLTPTRSPRCRHVWARCRLGATWRWQGPFLQRMARSCRLPIRQSSVRGCTGIAPATSPEKINRGAAMIVGAVDNSDAVAQHLRLQERAGT